MSAVVGGGEVKAEGSSERGEAGMGGSTGIETDQLTFLDEHGAEVRVGEQPGRMTLLVFMRWLG